MIFTALLFSCIGSDVATTHDTGTIRTCNCLSDNVSFNINIQIQNPVLDDRREEESISQEKSIEEPVTNSKVSDSKVYKSRKHVTEVKPDKSNDIICVGCDDDLKEDKKIDESIKIKVLIDPISNNIDFIIDDIITLE